MTNLMDDRLIGHEQNHQFSQRIYADSETKSMQHLLTRHKCQSIFVFDMSPLCLVAFMRACVCVCARWKYAMQLCTKTKCIIHSKYFIRCNPKLKLQSATTVAAVIHFFNFCYIIIDKNSSVENQLNLKMVTKR